jgi:hypothetical protein
MKTQTFHAECLNCGWEGKINYNQSPEENDKTTIKIATEMLQEKHASECFCKGELSIA